MIKNILEIAGYQVQVAVDGQQAWRLLQRGYYDLVVSDVEMPNMTGFELTAQIRADRRLKNLPVILVTSLDSHENKARGIQVGADAYIVKGSFDKDDLLSNVQQFI
jgi:two-component system chemotaxis sensor kinase CheA